MLRKGCESMQRLWAGCGFKPSVAYLPSFLPLCRPRMLQRGHQPASFCRDRRVPPRQCSESHQRSPFSPARHSKGCMRKFSIGKQEEEGKPSHCLTIGRWVDTSAWIEVLAVHGGRRGGRGGCTGGCITGEVGDELLAVQLRCRSVSARDQSSARTGGRAGVMD